MEVGEETRERRSAKCSFPLYAGANAPQTRKSETRSSILLLVKLNKAGFFAARGVESNARKDAGAQSLQGGG